MHRREPVCLSKELSGWAALEWPSPRGACGMAWLADSAIYSGYRCAPRRCRRGGCSESVDCRRSSSSSSDPGSDADSGVGVGVGVGIRTSAHAYLSSKLRGVSWSPALTLVRLRRPALC